MESMSHWELILFVAGLVAMWSIIILGVQKSMMSSGFKSLGNQIDQFQAASEKLRNVERELLELKLGEHLDQLRKSSEKLQGFEREILELKADLPLSYVRKEDFIRHEVVINTKLDRLRDLLEDLREKKNAA